MFKKVLIADDYGIVNIGVAEVLTTLGITNVQKAQYCDEAYLKFKKAILDQDPFDLLITDLSFKKDHRKSKLTSGEDLIQAIRKEDLQLSIIVYSMHSLLQKVRILINTYQVNAYICKDRNGTVDLSHAIQTVYKKEQYLSQQVRGALQPKNHMEIDDYDIELVYQLSNGLTQEEISVLFKNNNTTPSSLSSVEKRLNKLRIQFKAQKPAQLVAVFKDLGLI